MALGRRADFEMHSGDDLDLVITVQDPTGAGVVVSGVTDEARWQLGRLATGSVSPSQPGAPLVSKSLTSGIVVSGLSGYVVTLASGDTADLKTADYYHELEIVVSGRRTTAMYGIATVQTDLVE